MRPAWDEFENNCELEIKLNGKGGRRVIITHTPTGLKVEKFLEGVAFNFKVINALYTELEDKVKVQEKGKEGKNE